MNKVNDFIDFKRFIISELENKCSIRQQEIGILDTEIVDLVEDSLEFNSGLKNDNALYVFWHGYVYDLGKLTKISSLDKGETVVANWGDWNRYSS